MFRALGIFGVILCVMYFPFIGSNSLGGICEDLPGVLSLDESAPKFSNDYYNYPYGYMIIIPDGLTGYGSHVPAPQHGFGIVLSKDPKGYIWVDGSANTLYFESLEQLVEHELSWFREGNSRILSVKKEKIKLGHLPAYRLVIKYRCKNHSFIADKVVSIDNERQIIYTLSLISAKEKYSEYSDVFDKMAKSMQLIERE